MSTIIQIKRNSGTTEPGTSDLVVGEMAYAYDASNDGASAKLYIEAVNSSSAADIHVIGGKYYTDLLDHTAGTTTANSALLVDANKKLNGGSFPSYSIGEYNMKVIDGTKYSYGFDLATQYKGFSSQFEYHYMIGQPSYHLLYLNLLQLQLIHKFFQMKF